MNFCTNNSEQRNVGGLSNYFEHCKKRKIGEFYLKGKRANFIFEIPAAPFFEFQIPERPKVTQDIICDEKPDWNTALGIEVKEIESWVNLGVLSMFIHHGSYSECI